MRLVSTDVLPPQGSEEEECSWNYQQRENGKGVVPIGNLETFPKATAPAVSAKSS